MSRVKIHTHLSNIIERDKCTIDITDYKNLTRNTTVKFICICGNEGQKTMSNLIGGMGAFCKGCINVRRMKLRKESNLLKYGVEHVTQTKEFKNNIKQICLLKYGVDNPMKTSETKEKQKINCNTEEVRNKRKQTNLKRYGVENSMQNAELAEKNSKNSLRFKDFILPSGKIIKIQGNEPIAIKQLLDIGYDENDIITSKKDVPEIWYINKDEKKCRYYCDIYIKKENQIIEIKSKYTYEIDKENNILKANACLKAGYKYEFWVLPKRSEDFEVIEMS
jgi:hypothetical protein